MAYDLELAKAVRAACIRQAEDLIEVASRANEVEKFHIGFHLTVLALEEIGKIELFEISQVKDERGDDGRRFFDRHSGDHVAKLFFAIWGSKLAGRMNDGAEFRKWRDFASDVHSQRIASLYVAVKDEQVPAPDEAVEPGAVKSLLDYAGARLQLAKAVEHREPDPEHRELIVWFRRFSETDEARRFIFSRISMEKLRDSTDSQEWISWMKRTSDEEHARVRKLVEDDLGREVQPDAAEDRWQTTFELLSATHSIRQKEFREWNGASRNIKLGELPKNRAGLRLLVTLQDNIPLDRVQTAALNLSTHFTVAVNIATGGLFWPYLPEKSFPVAQSGRDLKLRLDLDVKASLYSGFRLITDNSERRVLTADDLARAAVLYSALAAPPPFVSDYWTGLAILCKSHPLLRLERQALEQLRIALDGAMRHYEPNNQRPLAERFAEWVHGMFDPQNADALTDTVSKDSAGEMSFHDAVNMKVCFDLYVQGQVLQRFLKQKKS